MPLPLTGPMTSAMINAELKRPVGSLLSIDSPEARALARIFSGRISYADFFGKGGEVFEATSLYVSQVAQQTSGDKIVTYSPAQRGLFWYTTDAYGYESAQSGSVTPNTFRGYRITQIAEQHGTFGVSETVHRFMFSLMMPGLPANFIKRIDIYSGATLHFSFNASAAVVSEGAVGSLSSGFSATTVWTWQLPASWHLTAAATYNVRIYYE